MIEDLVEQMAAQGYFPKRIVFDQTFDRYDRNGKKNAWFIGFSNKTRAGRDYFSAVCGDFKAGETTTFTPKDIRLTKSEKRELNVNLEMAKKVAESERLKNIEIAALEAEETLKRASNIGTSDYLLKKRIAGLYGAKILVEQNKNVLLVPMIDIDGRIYGVQRILPDGKKFFSAGQKTSGCFHAIPSLESVQKSTTVIIAEGFATAATIYEAIGLPVIVSFNAGNIEKVAKTIKESFLSTKILICGDNDRSVTKKVNQKEIPFNPGKEYAEKASQQVDGDFIIPKFKDQNSKGTDFNDLFFEEGIDVVKSQIKKGITALTKRQSEIFRPEIYIDQGQESDVIDKIVDTMSSINNISPTYFRQEDQLIKLFSTEQNGTKMNYLNKDNFLPDLVNIARWMKTGSEGISLHATVPERFAKILVAAPPMKLPQLDQILKLPYINTEKKLVSSTGYHPQDFVFLDSNNEMTSLVENLIVNDSEVDNSLKLLLDLISDFPFATEADKLHYLSTLFHPITRKLYSGPSPLMMINASRPGTGKSLLARMSGIVQNGEEPIALPWPKSEDERDKQITSAYMGGANLLFFDNVPSSKLDSSVLARGGTQIVWAGRVLGKNKIYSCPNLALWMFTTNNLRASTEITRRSPRIRLVSSKGLKNLTANKFKYPNIDLWVFENRFIILKAIYVLVLNWIEQGCRAPTTNRHLASFEEWSRVHGGIFEAAGSYSFLEGQEEYASILDDESDIRVAVYEIWWELFPNIPVRTSKLLEKSELAEHFSDLAGKKDINALYDFVGKKLKEWTDQVFEGFKLVLEQEGGRRSGRMYRLEKLVRGEGGYNVQ